MLVFSSKADTLSSLRGKIKHASVLPVIKFAEKEYKNKKEECLLKITSSLSEYSFLIIRSSAKNEDSIDSSMAGCFLSVGNVERHDKHALDKAICSVLDSYVENNEDNEFFVQPFLKNLAIAGVAFTADIDTLAPYYVINYDAKGSTDSVTSGSEGDFKTFISFKKSPKPIEDKRMRKLISALKELEEIFSNEFIDVEFGFDHEDRLHIFQVRPLVVKNKDKINIEIDDALLKVYKKIEKLSAPHPNLIGKKAIYGVMPDWNPAEIIGLKPKPLAYTLYKEIITDSIWAYQRDNYGYFNLRSHPLMLMFMGIPYIDVRVDFNSFVPKSLDHEIARKLVEYYIERLEKFPAVHDKVEFEIVHSCYHFNLPQRLESLLTEGFTVGEVNQIKVALLDLTNKIIEPNFGIYKKDFERIKKLEDKYTTVVESDLSLIDKIYWLIEDCKRYGTLPFAGIARSAFIATQFLKSLVEIKVINADDYNGFLKSLNTVTRKLNNQLQKHFSGEISRENFLKEYGHLRPGTYDITSMRYDEGFEFYFPSEKRSPYEKSAIFEFSMQQLADISSLLDENRIEINVPDLINFMKDAIENREYSKFIFTKSLSQALKYIEELGLKNGINKEDMAFVDIRTIYEMYACVEPISVKDRFEENIRRNKESYLYTKAIKLPALIVKPNDVYSFYSNEGEPNFITQKFVSGKVLPEDRFGDQGFDNCIVFIRSADPGYDFLFSKNIAGLVTQFGGANSHMAVRCAELGLPAVIGAGEVNFKNWGSANLLEIDCLSEQVKIIS